MAFRHLRILGGSVRTKATTSVISVRRGGCLISPTKIRNQSNNVVNHHHMTMYNHRRQFYEVPEAFRLRYSNRNNFLYPMVIDPIRRLDLLPLEGYEERDCVVDSARLAVNSHNKEQNAQLQFVRVVKVSYKPEDGMDLCITLEVNNAGKSALCYTIVHYQPWKPSGNKRIIAPLVFAEQVIEQGD